MAGVKETVTTKRERARDVLAALRILYPDAHCTLDYNGDPLRLLVMTILAAQCTDARVNALSKDLFARYHTAEDFVNTPQEDLEGLVRPAGFYRQKAKAIQRTCRDIVERFDGRVPDTMEDLTALHGVGRKTANVILGECYGGQGVIVDTHCGRLARRLGFTRAMEPGRIEKDLMKLWPEEHWTEFSHLMVFHGRNLCAARAPKCSQCPLAPALCRFPNTREGKKIAR